jgi:hypothetical protein
MNSTFKSKSGKTVGNFLDRYDLFSTGPSSFNIEGHKKFGTAVGCFFSILFIVIVLLYGVATAFFQMRTPIIYEYETEKNNQIS